MAPWLRLLLARGLHLDDAGGLLGSGCCQCGWRTDSFRGSAQPAELIATVMNGFQLVGAASPGTPAGRAARAVGVPGNARPMMVRQPD
jgi:hypothetical protein